MLSELKVNEPECSFSLHDVSGRPKERQRREKAEKVRLPDFTGTKHTSDQAVVEIVTDIPLSPAPAMLVVGLWEVSKQVDCWERLFLHCGLCEMSPSLSSCCDCSC